MRSAQAFSPRLNGHYLLECVTAVAMLIDPSIRSAVIGEEHQACMIACAKSALGLQKAYCVESVTFRRTAQQVKGSIVIK